MALYFEGTSTGKRYEVGQPYEMNGKRYIAQADGSFQREGAVVARTEAGKVVRETVNEPRLKGSSGNTRVRWFADGKEAVAFGGGSKGGLVGSTGNGQELSRTNSVKPGTVAKNTMFSPGNLGRNVNEWSGKDDPPQDNLFGGVWWRANPKYTNAAMFEERYGEVGEVLIGLGVLGADIGYNARLAYDASNLPKNQKDLALVAQDAGDAAVRGVFSLWDTITNAANDRRSFEERRDRRVAEEMDAIDYRLQLQGDEWNKQFTVVNPPKSQERLPANVWGY